MMSGFEEETAFKDLPYYKSILKVFLRKQIRTLIEELATETGEESVILMANTSTGTTSCLSSSNAKHFIEAHNDIQSRFLTFCVSGFQDINPPGTRTPKIGKRKAKDDSKSGTPSKQAKQSCLLSPPGSTGHETFGRTVHSAGIETVPSLSSRSSESMSSKPLSEVSSGTYPENEENHLNDEKKMAPACDSSSKSESYDGVNIKVEPLTDEIITDFTIIKTEPESDTGDYQGNESSDISNFSSVQTDQGSEHSMMSSSGSPVTFGPIRFVRKFPPKERTTLSLPEKIQIIQDYESGVTTSQRKLADKYNISKSAVADMLKNRQLLKEHYEFNANTKRKRFNTSSKFADINEVVWQWFRTARENGIQMSGPMIQEKALQVAQELNVKDFKGSNGWLHSWKSRYNITSYRDDVNGGQKQSYINDYSKVEGFDASTQNSEAANAIMNLGSLTNLYNSSSSNQQATCGSYESSTGLQQGSSDSSGSASIRAENQLPHTMMLESCEGEKQKQKSGKKEGMEVNNPETSAHSVEKMIQSASYEKIVQNAVSEFEDMP